MLKERFISIESELNNRSQRLNPNRDTEISSEGSTIQKTTQPSMVEFGVNSPLRKGPAPPRTNQGLLVSSQSAKSVETDSLTSSLITNSTPKIGTMERMAMLKLKNSTNRMSHVDLQKRRNTDKRNYIKNSKKSRKKKTNYYGLTSEQSSKLEQTKNRLLSKAPMT